MKTVKADLHNHFTTKSRVLDPNQVADRVHETLGDGAICALVNYDDRRFEAFSKKAEPYANILGNAVHFSDRNITIIKGEEIKTQEGDILSLGLEEGIHPFHGEGLGNTLRESTAKGGTNIIPHPYFRSNVGKMLEREPFYFSLIHAIEVHNNNASEAANKRALDLWNKSPTGIEEDHTVGRIASTDGHSFEAVGSSYTEFEPWEPVRRDTNYGLIQDLTNLLFLGKRTLHGTYTPKDKWTHAAVIIGVIAASKLRIPISRGDPEALH